MGNWSNRVKAAILTAGALAGAIGAILALLPKSSPDREAAVANLHIDRDVPIDEFTVRTSDQASAIGPGGRALAQGEAVAVPAASRSLLASLITSGSERPDRAPGNRVDLAQAPSDSSPGGQAPQGPGPTPEGESASPASPQGENSTGESGPGSTTTPQNQGTVRQKVDDKGVVHPVLSQQDDAAIKEDINAHGGNICTGAADEGTDCLALGDACQNLAHAKCALAQAIAPDASTSPAKAAARLARLFRGTRVVSVGGTRQPVGVTVNFDFTAVGFKGQRVNVRWSLYGAGTHRAIPRDWLKDQTALVVRPRAEKDTKSPTFWVPLPKARGPFFIRVGAFDEHGTRLTYKDTPTFK